MTTTVDVTTEMLAVTEGRKPVGDFLHHEWAADVVAHLREQDAGLLRAWLDMNAVRFLAADIAQRNRYERRRKPLIPEPGLVPDPFIAGHFDDDVPVFVERQSLFDKTMTLENNIQRRIGDLRREDAAYICADYKRRRKQMGREEAFWAMVTRKIPVGKTLGDVMTPDAYLALRSSCGFEPPKIVGPVPPPV